MIDNPPPPPPEFNTQSSASLIWTLIDKRINNAVLIALAKLGRPRSRTVTINFPAAGTTTPVAGWIASVGIAHNIKVVGWSINAVVAGQITLDLRVSTIADSPSIAPPMISLPGSSHYMSLNGYSTFSVDTTGWVSNMVNAGNILHVFVISATNIQQAILVLRVIDTDSKTLAP